MDKSKMGNRTWKRRIFDIIQIGNREDVPSRLFDILITISILLNLFAIFFETFESSKPYSGILYLIELITVLFFTVEYILRLWTSDYLYPDKKPLHAAFCFLFSLTGLIDLISFLPFYLPFFFPAGTVAFRMFRIVRIFRLFQVNSRSDAFHVIGEVFRSKANQLASSVFIIFVIMMASSLCMYGLEHPVQPDVFKNAFSGLWWTVSTLTTVGYGDIYPITVAGQILGIFITFLGIGIVAIPTGIISAGFVEHYTKVQNAPDGDHEFDLQFIGVDITKNHPWVNRKIRNLSLIPGVILAVIYRNNDIIIPKGDVTICENDHLIIGSHKQKKDINISLKEIYINQNHKWKDTLIRDLPISRQTLILMIKRDNQNLIPDGSMRIHCGDRILIYQKDKNSPL